MKWIALVIFFQLNKVLSCLQEVEGTLRHFNASYYIPDLTIFLR